MSSACFNLLFFWERGLRDRIREFWIKVGTLGHLAVWVELVEPHDGSLKVLILPLISCFM